MSAAFTRADISLANWRTRPFNQFSFQNVAEFVPSADVARHHAGKWQAEATDLGEMSVTHPSLGRTNVAAFLAGTHGDAFVHVSRLAAVVEVDHPLPELVAEPIDDVARSIGAHVASLVEDGDTIQTGIGATSATVRKSSSDLASSASARWTSVMSTETQRT